MKSIVKVGIAGLGTVGSGVAKLLVANADVVEARTGTAIKVVAVSARRQVSRGFDMDGIRWYEDARDLAKDPEVDIVVEVIGGSEGIAKEVCELALKQGKHVVTANKALIAHHGIELATLAESQRKVLAFEAAVAGGIPILKMLKEGLAANRFSRVAGILNGTGNYILTTMQQTGKDFEVVLKEAQDLGYAEADPSFDVDGIDAAHKLAILASLAFGTKIAFDEVYIEGIRHINSDDIRYAEELGMKIKLLGICQYDGSSLRQSVYPCLVSLAHPIAKVDGVFNAVEVEGDPVGKMMIQGRGAGEGPTASAVVADIVDIASLRRTYPFGMALSQLHDPKHLSQDDYEGSFYVRLRVQDSKGVVADVTRILSQFNISIDSFSQKAHQDPHAVKVMLSTHRTTENNLKEALAAIKSLSSVISEPVMIRIAAV
ncbi:MAG: homoserine dehydrogenase [Alphaproteobacteria bacterium]|nr:homoserine dehydrogenase [Alphaproteobacteria bacterium]